MMLTRAHRAFTLLETLVVIGIVVILAALILPAIQRVRATVEQVRCQTRLKQLGLALAQYHTERGRLPPGCSWQNGQDPLPHLTWMARLLPYLDRADLWQATVEAFRQEPFFMTNPPHTPFTTVVPAFLCPVDDRTNSFISGAALTGFLGVSGTNQHTHDGVLFLDSRIRFSDITDGLSNTVMVGERPANARRNLGWWYGGWGMAQNGAGDSILGARELNTHPSEGDCPPGPYVFQRGTIDDPCAAFHFWSLHPGGGHFLFADQSVRFLRYSATDLLPALATRAGKEPVVLD